MTHESYLAIADIIATHSKALRNKVGAILVKNNNIISMGYNGTPYGFDNNCEDDNGNTVPEVVHAELNAIIKCAKDGISCDGATLYCTLSPCIDCAKIIVQSGIKQVVYKTKYRLTDGLELLGQYVEVLQCQ
jgi:dCMP deaminase